MKPREQQKDLITKISKEIAGWANVSNIDSKVIYISIEQFCETLEMQRYQSDDLYFALEKIIDIIKEIEEIK